MDLFRETLEKYFQKKREALAVLKSAKSETIATATEAETASTAPPRLDYSISKTLKAIEDFAAERQKRSKKAKVVKDTDL